MTDTAQEPTNPDSPPAEVPAEIGPQQPEADMLDSVVFDMLPTEAQAPLEFLSDYPLVLLCVVVALGYGIGKLLQFFLTQISKRFSSRTSTKVDDKILAVIRRPALTVPIVLSLFIVTAIVPMPSGMREFTVSMLSTIVLLSLLRTSLKASHFLLELLAERRDTMDIIEARTLPMFEMTSKILLVTIAGYLALLIWGVDPTAWLASAGVIGIAVGFAARDTLANLFSGIFIVADAPYKLGDYVVLDTGERGEVTHVGLRSTRLLTRDDIEVTIPNAIIANAKIINESGGPWEKYRIRIPVAVAYGSDVDQVSDVLYEVARDNSEILEYPNPRVRMRRFGVSSLDFELLGWVDKPVHRGRVTDLLLKEIYKRFITEGITIPFPQTDVYLHRVERNDDD